MVRIAVLGANGQVGSEMCLLLSKLSDVELVAICRNRSGSAFLRWCGIACRHGRPADPADAPRLLGDCDVILNFALASGNPAQIRSTEDRLIHNSFAFSKPGATVVYFSTQSVYGDPNPGRRIRWRNPYGRAKRVSESRVLAGSRHWRKRAFILRLGHVCGELQGISLDMRRELREERVALPEVDVPSNTVLTVSILDAIEQIISDCIQPGVYDLMNTPQWSWSQVYRYEAQRCGVPFDPTLARSAASGSAGRGWRLLGIIRKLASHRWNRELLAKLLAYAPASVSQRAQATWYCQRARSEIGPLSATPGHEPADHLSWVSNGRRPLPQRPTEELLRNDPYRDLLDCTSRPSWPPDLPHAATVAEVPAQHSPQVQVE